MTLSTLAKLAGVSVSTVSKAFSGSIEISASTRNKIFEVAKENGCFEKYYKSTYGKKVIAVICPEIISEYYSTIVTSLEEAINCRGGLMVLSLSHFNRKLSKELFDYHSYFQKTDGIILIGATEEISNGENIPGIALGAENKHKNIDTISINYAEAINEAVCHLAENGHRDIGFIGEKLTESKRDYFIGSLKSNNLRLNNDYIVTTEKRFEQGGYHAMEELFRRNAIPTAILFAYDNMAFGAIKSIKDHGLSVPDDISLIGMDDISAASHPHIPLTTIRVHIEDLCNIALDLLFKKMESRYYTSRQDISVSCSLVKRNSVKRIT